MSAQTKIIGTDQDLRGHLDALNDAGQDSATAGMDANGIAFLIWLAGIYAESEVVLTIWPWDCEVEHASATACDGCGASRKDLGMEDLVFPVTILTSPSP